MTLKPADIFTLLRDAFLAFGQDKAPRLAAAIAYYAMFSLAPLLLLAVLVAGQFLSSGTVLDDLFGPAGIVAQNLGLEAADFLRGLIDTDALQKGSVIATIAAFVTLFMGATGLFVQLQDALNSMWGADPGPPQGFVNVLWTRVKSFLMILAIGLLLIAFLGVNTYLSAIAQRLGDTIGAGAFFVRAGTALLSVLFLAPVFAGIYKVLPDVKLEWREVWVGGFFTSTLFTLGQLGIGLYLGQAAPGSAFGAAATLIVLLLWIYYSAMIFFFGAEVTWVYSQKFGTHAGGAANTAKKQALAAQGAEIDPTESQQERDAKRQADSPVRDSRGRVLGVPVPRVLPRVPRREEGRVLPTVRAAIWNAVTAVLAVPAVIVLRVLGITGGRRK
ncbi:MULTISPECIES: YihY/virulence factor BrkB family protein [unclassified Deinococcus]|uniref:YihY/virulence factor BrkB family protein n=1 Tax=unclassified Deinococcus TaxID=2623546 RepID=UPI000C17CC2B|nr:YihY/virulence factor BrkB family protein [Deinococcus sp. UR1]MCD0166694.1 YihY/virulence factor BrkB family protein [Deinococcus sp. 12RED42]PIG96271.1 ribonuclease BN [Deinococcus sp. UR1]